MMSKFLVMWCSEGLETLINITAIEQNNIMKALKGENFSNYNHSNPIQHMILRAKFNTQRHYEIFFFESEIDEDEIKNIFDTDPQLIVDAIRRVGQEIYSDRVVKDRIVIR